MGVRLLGFVTCSLTALFGCGAEVQPAGEVVTTKSMPIVDEFDPFAADMGVWTCSAYMAALRDTEYRQTLERLLEVRPHAYWEPAPLEDLLELDAAFVSESRRAAPMYRHLIHKEVIASLKVLIRAAEAEGLDLRVQSAFRSPSYQNLLWKRGIRRSHGDLSHAAFTVAPPCFSEHATGRAVDFSSGGVLSGFEHSPEYRWLSKNGAKWNWVQSFREDNGGAKSPSSRGIWVEPWHYHHQSLRP